MTYPLRHSPTLSRHGLAPQRVGGFTSHSLNRIRTGKQGKGGIIGAAFTRRGEYQYIVHGRTQPHRSVSVIGKGVGISHA